MKKDLTKHHVECAVSNSVMNECNTKMNELGTFLRELLVSLISDQVTAKRKRDGRLEKDPIDSRDMLAIEDAFRQIYDGIGIASVMSGKYPMMKSIPDLGPIEAFIVESFNEASGSKKPPDPMQWYIQLTAWALKRVAEINLNLDRAIRIQHEFAAPCPAMPALDDITKIQNAGLSKDDAAHIASALGAQRSGLCRKAVFVTVDYKSILKHRSAVKNDPQVGLTCTMPLYAVHHALSMA